VNAVLKTTIAQAAGRRKQPLWLVGGPVRDDLLEVPCKDWDFVARQARSLAKDVARRLGAKFIVLDEENRIYRVILPEQVTLDFAELQGPSIEADLGRRDFTINAMAQAFPDGERIDPFHGQRDLRQKVVRAFSEKSFVEDPLRTLRAFRFAAQFQFAIDARTVRWIRQHRHGLQKVSAERIREELLRLWKQPCSAPSLRLMDRAGLLCGIFPEMEACRRTAIRYYGKGGVLRHSFETVENLEWIFDHLNTTRLFAGSIAHSIKEYLTGSIGGYPRTAWLKWAAFLHDVGKPATAKVIKGRLRFFEHEHVGASLALKISQRLRLSRQEMQLLGLWVRNHMRTGNLAAAPRITDKALSRYFRDLGEDGVGMILISLADHYTYLRSLLWAKGTDPVDKISRKLLTAYYEDRAKILPEKLVNGHVLMKKLKLKPGPLIGELLEALQDAQAEGKITTAVEALAFAKKKIRC